MAPLLSVVPAGASPAWWPPLKPDAQAGPGAWECWALPPPRLGSEPNVARRSLHGLKQLGKRLWLRGSGEGAGGPPADTESRDQDQSLEGLGARVGRGHQAWAPEPRRVSWS